ncbi:hypothetical protein EON66_00370 [archaeon]|nr:MAG: hypothetical protein EON66_00370 [archaeon]
MTHKYCSNLTITRIPHASHWVQQDAVQEVLDSIGDFVGVAPAKLPYALPSAAAASPDGA